MMEEYLAKTADKNKLSDEVQDKVLIFKFCLIQYPAAGYPANNFSAYLISDRISGSKET